MMIKQLNHPSCPEYFDVKTMPNLPLTQFYPGQTLKLKAREDAKIRISVKGLYGREIKIVILPTETVGNLKE